MIPKSPNTLRILFFASLVLMRSVVFGDPESRPDIVVFIADDQNYWDYGFAGNDAVETPNIDSFATEAARFGRAYASMSICAPSRSTIYTGLYPLRNGCFMNHTPSRNGTLSIAQRLKPLGYDVVLAGKGHVAPNSVYDWTRFIPLEKLPNNPKKALPFGEIESYLREADRSFCLFLASDLPHGPYPDRPALKADDFYRPEGLAGGDNLKRAAGYYASIAEDDRQLGRVIALLKRSGKWDNTVFIYLSDHGIDGKYTVYDKGLRVPLLVRSPDGAMAGEGIEGLVSLADLLPTIMEIAGGKPPTDVDGVSLLPLLRGERNEVRENVLGVQTWQNTQKAKVFPSRALVEKRFKLIVNYNAAERFDEVRTGDAVVDAFLQKGGQAFHWIPEFELYDLLNDPFEKTNLSKKVEYEEVLERMKSELEQQLLEQGDFVLEERPKLLLKPNHHSLDSNTKWKTVAPELEGRLQVEHYREAHY